MEGGTYGRMNPYTTLGSFLLGPVIQSADCNVSSMIPRLLILMVVGGLVAPSVFAQPDSPGSPAQESQEVRETIEALFDAMRAGDSTAARAVFDEAARLQTAVGPEDTTALRATSIDAFVEAVGHPREQVWDERVWDVEIKIDGPLASAWVPYAFYLGDELSHCGVNAIQLVQTAEGWRILQLTDTRRETCDVPAEIRKE